ncbi:MAG TPA: cobaltochelatase subunit CobN, partial [Dehalococcoidia bacterium]|nr:cobaltochelatase subunit CobN [Dehalococcoidia bacterium]
MTDSLTTQLKTILLVTTADTDILAADRAVASLSHADFPLVRAFNPAALDTPEARQELLDAAGQAGVVVLRLLGGKRAMAESFDPLVRLCRARNVPLIACPGHEEWDEDLVGACSAPVAEVETVFSYLLRGGVQNLQNLFLFLSDTYLGTSYGHDAPAPVPWEGIYHPDFSVAETLAPETFIAKKFRPGRPTVGLLFYRAHWMSGNLGFIDALVRRLEELGANVLPVFSYSLKHSPEDEEAESEAKASRALTQFMAAPGGAPRVHCIVNTMGLAMSELSREGPTIASGWSVDYLDQLNVPIIQGIVSTGSRQQWQDSTLGLGPIDT